MTKAVILAGGLGTRISEETVSKPKPMITIGGRPILWHIMKIYAAHGINEFVFCLGYKGYCIKEYFANYFLHSADVTIDIGQNAVTVHNGRAEDWRVTLVDTGTETMTGGRLKRVRRYVANDTFCLTYGDGVADIDITELLRFHKAHRRQATVTAVRPPGRFGSLNLGEDNAVSSFVEKPDGDGSWINGGFFVLEPEVIDLIDGDDTVFEQQPLKTLATNNQLSAFHHRGFWQPMDTLRDMRHLEELWSSGRAPWRVW
jgi:glucose-1-phosphate cytidylyltransferase